MSLSSPVQHRVREAVCSFLLIAAMSHAQTAPGATPPAAQDDGDSTSIAAADSPAGEARSALDTSSIVAAADTGAAPVAPLEAKPGKRVLFPWIDGPTIWPWVLGGTVLVGGGIAAISILASGNESSLPTSAATTGGTDSDGSWNTTVRWK